MKLDDDESAFKLSREALLLVPADDTAAAQLAKTADRLDRLDELASDVRPGLEDRISSNGRPDLADLLRSAPVAAIA